VAVGAGLAVGVAVAVGGAGGDGVAAGLGAALGPGVDDPRGRGVRLAAVADRFVLAAGVAAGLKLARALDIAVPAKDGGVWCSGVGGACECGRKSK
jgi:hypothetical protein